MKTILTILAILLVAYLLVGVDYELKKTPESAALINLNGYYWMEVNYDRGWPARMFFKRKLTMLLSHSTIENWGEIINKDLNNKSKDEKV